MGNMKKPSAAKKGSEPAKNKKAVPVKKKKTEPAEPAAPKKRAPIFSGETLRRVLIAAVALLCCFGFVLSAVSVHGELLQRKAAFPYQGVQQRDCLFPIDFEEGQLRALIDSTKRHGQTRAFTYFCNSALQVNEATMTGYILFGNPAGNDCDLVLSIVDENGDVIYRSDGVKPGSYITQIRPSIDPQFGTQECTAYVSGYTGTDEPFLYKCVGVQHSRLIVQMGESS